MYYTFVSLMISDKHDRDLVLTLRNHMGREKNIYFSERSRQPRYEDFLSAGVIAGEILRGPGKNLDENLVHYLKHFGIRYKGQPRMSWEWKNTGMTIRM